jgi:hypothetical protein
MGLIQQKRMEPKEKKKWSKPKLFSGKGIGFLGLGQVQSSTGPYGTPS